MADASEYHTLKPEGLALSLLLVTIIFTILSSFVVSLRFYVRITRRNFGVEDWLMLVGWILNVVHNAFVVLLSISGIGAHDDMITIANQKRIGLYIVMWQFFYVTCGALIKCSIIYTMIRVAVQKHYIYTLWGLFVFAICTWIISWPVAIFQCKPVAAAWGEPGDCTSGQAVTVAVTYFVSVANILTDVATALIPIGMLWDVQMRKKLKIVTACILGLGVFASMATVARLPYSGVYTATTEKFYVMANIVIWTVLECDLGIIAGSLPLLRTLFKSLAKDHSTDPAGRSGSVPLATFGGSRGPRSGYKLDGSINVTISGPSPEAHFRDGSSGNDDDESTRHIIRVTRQVEQQSIVDLDRHSDFNEGMAKSRNDHY